MIDAIFEGAVQGLGTRLIQVHCSVGGYSTREFGEIDLKEWSRCSKAAFPRQERGVGRGVASSTMQETRAETRMVRRRMRCSCVDEKERIGIRKGIRFRGRGTIDGSSSVRRRAGSKAHKKAKVGVPVGSNSCPPFGEAKAGGFIRDSRASRKVRYEVEIRWFDRFGG
jgi:hypothetical protein